MQSIWIEEAISNLGGIIVIILQIGITEAFEKLKPAFEQVGKAITEAFRKTKWTGLQLRKELISNNRRKMKGMPLIRAKAIEKARRNERRKPKKQKEGVQCAK